MITRGGMSEIMYYRKLRSMGLSEEYFFSLPFDIQKAILMAGNTNEYDTEPNIEIEGRKIMEKVKKLFEKK